MWSLMSFNTSRIILQRKASPSILLNFNMIEDESDYTVMVNGDTMTMSQLVAIAASLEQERPHLFGFLRSFHSSNEEMTLLFRQMIRDDYDHHASNHNYKKDDLEQEQEREKEEPVPPMARTTSLQQSLELALRLEEMDAAREQEEVRILANELADEDRRCAQLFLCVICRDEEACIHGAITLDCNHRFCEVCLSSFICNKINKNEISEQELKCPNPDCTFSISHPTIRGCTEGVGQCEVYEKFLTFATDKYLQEAIQAGGALRCPNETCNYVFQWRPDGSSVAFTCDKCSSQYCLSCELVGGEGGGGGIGPGHAPLTCAEQREKMERDLEEARKFKEWQQFNANSEQLFEKMVKANGWKRCPSCRSPIERTEGCDHMTCKACKCNFCFVCGKHSASNPTSRGDCGTTCSSRKR